MAVPPATFARQMETLDRHRHSLQVLSLEEAASELASPRPTRRSVVLTFDDAWADNHANAIAHLAEHRLPAVLYTPSRLLGTPGYMTRAQLLEMVDAGITVGAHTRTHPDLRSCSDADLESEIRGGREDLEELVGGEVTSFAYPTGLYDERVQRSVAAAGFTSAVTTRWGWWRPSTPAHTIPRCFVEDMSDDTFAAAARGGLTALAPLETLKGALPARA